jgi:SAM-dependent methyltransferase
VPSIVERVAYKVLKPLHTRQCPCCGWHGFAFDPYGQLAWRRDDAMCPWCHSLERHRLVYLLLRDELAKGGWKTLHVAPELSLRKWLQGVSSDYLSIDTDGTAMAKMDLMALDLPDNSKTLVWCSHVLEHVPDDRKAMAEMFRVLAPGGLAVIQVPVDLPKTDEDPDITDPAERLRRFQQEDHVRIYGMDVVDRLKGAGFDVQVRRPQDFSRDVVRKHSLTFRPTNEVFVCLKPGEALFKSYV